MNEHNSSSTHAYSRFHNYEHSKVMEVKVFRHDHRNDTTLLRTNHSCCFPKEAVTYFCC